jgi:hypothetical protein
MANNYDLNRIVGEIRKYVMSPRGQRELADAMRKAEETCRQMEEASRIRREDLFIPFDI